MLQHVVFVWDVEDTLVPLHSLITGAYSRAAGAGAGLEQGRAAALGRQLQALVLQLADAHMHFKEVCGGFRLGQGQGEGGKTAAHPQPEAYLSLLPMPYVGPGCTVLRHPGAHPFWLYRSMSRYAVLSCAVLQLEDVDTVNVCDVWYLAAQYEQRQNRRRHAQQQQEREGSGEQEQQEHKQQGAAAKEGLPNGRSPTPAAAPADKTASPEQQGPAPKRARLAQEQQQKEQQRKPSSTPPASAGGGTARAASRSGTDGSQSPQAGQGPISGKGSKAAKAEEGAEGGQQQGSDATRSGSAGSEQPGSTRSRAAAAEADAADVPLAAAGGDGGVAPAELVLPPYKLGPRPDKLQQLWDDVAKVRARRRLRPPLQCAGCQCCKL